MKKESLKVIFLDWHNTICRDIFWQHLDASETKEAYDKIRNFWHENTSSEFINKWMIDELNCDDIVEKISLGTNLEKKFIKDNLIQSSKNMKFIVEEIPSLIKKIQQNNIKVVLASDNMDVFNFTIKSLKLNSLFDNMLLSNNLKAVKKSINSYGNLPFFESFLQKNNLKYSDCVLVDDSKNVAKVCEIVGMNNICVGDCEKEIIDILNSFI